MYSDRIVQELYELQQRGEEEGRIVNEGSLHPPGRDYRQAEHLPGPGAWIDGDWKLHRRGPDYLLFHLKDDPGEQHNLVDEHPRRTARMQRELRSWEESVIESLRGADY